MSRWTDIAEWIGPTANRYRGRMGSVSGVVLHIQDGTEAGTESWQRNPGAQVSSHFTAPRAGGLRQMVDTADAAWAEVSGNLHWLSLECEGYGGQPLTPGQIEAAAQLLARAHRVYGVPLQACDDPLLPGACGLTGHGKGGAAWGGHYDCPGDPVLAARPAIIERAAAIASGSSSAPTPTPAPTQEEDDDMPIAILGTLPENLDEAILCPPPPNTAPNWGNVWISFGASQDVHVAVRAYVDGKGWETVSDSFLIPGDGDRANPFGGPAPAGLQKLGVRRIAPPDSNAVAQTASVGWLIEAVKH